MTITALAISPDGTRFASGDRFGTVRIWEAREGKLLHEIQAHVGPCEKLAFSADGRTVFSIGFEEKTLRSWNCETGEERPPIEFDHPLVGLELFPDGSSLVVGGWSKTFKCYHPDTLEHQFDLESELEHGNELILSPDGNHAVIFRNGYGTGPEMGILRRGPDHTLEVLHAFPAPMHDSGFNGVVFNSDGSALAAGFNDGVVRTWHRQEDGTWEEGVSFKVPGGAFSDCVIFDSSGSRLITGDRSGYIRFWSLGEDESVELVATLPAPAAVTSLAISPDGNLLLAGTQHGILQMWLLAEDSRAHTALEEIGSQGLDSWFARGAQAIALARTRRLLFTPARESDPNADAILAWKLNGLHLTPAFELDGKAGPVTDLAVSPDERYLVAVSRGVTRESKDTGSVLLWDLETKEHRVLLEEGGLATIAFTPDGKTLAAHISRGDDPVPIPIRFWDVETGGEPVAESVHFEHMAFGLAFTKDGRQLIVGHSFDGEPLRVFDFDPQTRETKLVRTIPGNSGRLTQLKVSPDGTFLISASTHGAHTMLWDLPEFTPRGTVPRIELSDWGFSSAISPDGSLVAVGGGNSKVVVARTDGSGGIVARYQGPSRQVLKYVSALEFDADNRTLLMSFNDGRIVLWKVPSSTGVVEATRYLDLIDLEDATGRLEWNIRSTNLVPATSPQTIAEIGPLYLPVLEPAAPAEENRLALFEYYLGRGQFLAAHAVLLTVDPSQAPPLWTQLSSALANALLQAKATGQTGSAGAIRRLALSVFEDYPPALAVQLTMLLEDSAWDQLGNVPPRRDSRPAARRADTTTGVVLP